MFWGISGILEWLEGLGAEDRGSCEIWEFFKGFNGILEGLETIRKYFLKLRGSSTNFLSA
jgi:hypothetical protein